jgi:hypothetical protein
MANELPTLGFCALCRRWQLDYLGDIISGDSASKVNIHIMSCKAAGCKHPAALGDLTPEGFVYAGMPEVVEFAERHPPEGFGVYTVSVWSAAKNGWEYKVWSTSSASCSYYVDDHYHGKKVCIIPPAGTGQDEDYWEAYPER